MLVTGDKAHLDFLPSPEAIQRFNEEFTDPQHEMYRLGDHSDLKNLEKRSGHRIHSSDFILGIQRANPRIIIEKSINFEQQWGLYIEQAGRKRYLSWVPAGWIREFSCYLVDERNLMKDWEIRGWRTVLIRLLGFGVISWEEVHGVFGDAEGINSVRWRKLTLHFREGCASRKILSNQE